MRYQHPQIGFAFDVPPGWALDNVHQGADGLIVVHRKGPAGLFLRIVDTRADAAARLAQMKTQLASAGAIQVDACGEPAFAGADDNMTVCFELEGHEQRWISARRDGYDYSLSHTGPWQEAEAAVRQVASSFVFPAPAVIRHALPGEQLAAVSSEAPSPLSPLMQESGARNAPAGPSQASDANIEARFDMPSSARPSLWRRLGAWLRARD